ASGASRIWSPWVLISTTSPLRPACSPSRRCFTYSACHTASWLERVAIRRSRDMGYLKFRARPLCQRGAGNSPAQTKTGPQARFVTLSAGASVAVHHHGEFRQGAEEHLGLVTDVMDCADRAVTRRRIDR